MKCHNRTFINIEASFQKVLRFSKNIGLEDWPCSNGLFVTLCYDSAARAESGADDSDSECVMTAC